MATGAGEAAGAWRVLIAGGGVAGLSLALALKRALGRNLDVVLCDPALTRDPSGDRRAYAIAAGARRMLVALGVWDAVAAEAQPMLDMVVTDSRLHDPVRPAFLTFDGEVEPGEPFAHMVESGVLTAALLAASRDAGVDVRPEGVRGFGVDEASVAAELSGGDRIEAALLVAADGARSRLREEAGIAWVGWSYPQSGLVATIGHERDHEGRAVEHFLPSGPSRCCRSPRRGLGAPHLHRLDGARRGGAPVSSPSLRTSFWPRSSAVSAWNSAPSPSKRPCGPTPSPSASPAASSRPASPFSATRRTSSTRSPARG
jgi:2-polyprenyl-6-methoxyphenol hydroxylase-like FAD-dependent oxidoreductase